MPTAVIDQHKRIFCEATTNAAEETGSKAYTCRACRAEFSKLSLSDLRTHRVAHQESTMIMQFAKEVGFPTHLVTAFFQASIPS